MSGASTPVLAIRPEPGLSSTVGAGRELGLEMHSCALSEVSPVAWDNPDLSRFDALLIGSANAIRHGGENLAQLTHLPVHAVGEVTAKEARAAGFTIERLGRGGLQTVLDEVEPPVRYLRLVGTEYVDLNWPDDVSFEPVQVYEVSPHPLSEYAAKLLQCDAIVLLHSAAMTRQFIAECERLGVDRSRVTLAAMGERIAQPARDALEDSWAAIHISDEPSDTALLAMVAKLCH